MNTKEAAKKNIAEELCKLQAQIRALSPSVSFEEMALIRTDDRNQKAAEIDGVGVRYEIWSIGEYGDHYKAIEFPTTGCGSYPVNFRVVYDGRDYLAALSIIVGDIAQG